MITCGTFLFLEALKVAALVCLYCGVEGHCLDPHQTRRVNSRPVSQR